MEIKFRPGFLIKTHNNSELIYVNYLYLYDVNKEKLVNNNIRLHAEGFYYYDIEESEVVFTIQNEHADEVYRLEKEPSWWKTVEC